MPQAATPDESDEDPANPQFWDIRYRRGRTPWDLGRVPERLASFLATAPAPGRVLVPGCGSGHELAALACAGWQVTAVDFSAAAIELARSQLGNLPGTLIHADFFNLPLPAGGFDLVYERTFLCAIPPARRTQWAAAIDHALAPTGRLAGLFFLAASPSPPDGGPPFPIARTELNQLLAAFHCHVDQPPGDSPALFAGQERWMVWRRNDD
jgi:SAM-dependent methyltransferase